MNELEWHRQMRALRTPVAPRRDLWADIDAALDGARPAAPVPARRSRHAWALAASVAGLALLAAGTAWMLQHAPATMHAPAVAQAPTPAAPSLTRWKPSDPRLAGAAIELDAAQMELRQALKQAPNSDALQRLLDRTERQQAQWRQLEKQAG